MNPLIYGGTMLSWTLMASLAMAEPDRNELTDPNATVTASNQPILTPQEIYQLLDEERWSKGVVEARRLISTNPDSGLAYLTLGDALSHYPNTDGDVYLAFDAWMMAKSLTPVRSSLNRVAQKRVAWALESTGIIKFEPSDFVGANGFGEGIRIEVFSPVEVDWSSRIEASKGAVYITNIPPGKVVMKVTSDLGVFVQETVLEGGDFQTVSVPTVSVTMEAGVEAGEWLPYLEAGRQTIDTVVQSMIDNPRVSFDEFSSSMIQIPKAPVPVDSTTTFISPHRERIVYNNGTRQTLIGGLYIIEVEKNGQKTYADIVVHPDLSVDTIRRLVLNDELRRNSMDSPIVRETMSDSQVVSPDSLIPLTPQSEVVTSAQEENDNGALSLQVPGAEQQTVVPEVSDASQPQVESQEDTQPSTEPVAAVDNDVPEQDATVLVPEQSEDMPSEMNLNGNEDTSINTVVESNGQHSQFVWDPDSSLQLQRTSLYVTSGAVLFTSYAMYRADHFADLANAEQNSQAKFDSHRTMSEQWQSNFLVGSIVTGHIASLYFGTKLLEWWAVEENATGQNKQATLQTVGTQTVSKGGQ